MQALLLPLGEDWYALELDAVREVVPAPVITPVPRSPATVLGVFNLRGEVVPVFDTAALLGLGRLGVAAQVTVVDATGGPAGLASDGLPVRAALDEPAGPSELTCAIGRFALPGGGVATLLDANGLLAAVGAA